MNEEGKNIRIYFPASIWREIWAISIDEINKEETRKIKEYETEMDELEYYKRQESKEDDILVEYIIFSIGIKKLIKEGLKHIFLKEFFRGD